MSELHFAALGYAALGWPVLPLEPRGKRPAGRLAPHGLHDATTDVATIERWWRASPEANVGLRTGVAFDVLDVDGRAGQDVLFEIMPAGAWPLGSGPWAMTPGKVDSGGQWLGGGDHVLYLPTGHGNKAGFVPGLDWRGAGGYIVAPPSVHPDGTGRYEWALGPDHELSATPAWLAGLLEPEAPTAAPVDLRPIADVSAYAQRALEGEVGRVAMAAEGQRNHTLNAAAYSLGQLIGAGTLDARTVAEQLLNVAVRVGLTETEAVATIRSGLKGGIANPRRQSA